MHRLHHLLAPHKVITDPRALSSFTDDFNQLHPKAPSVVVQPTTVEDVQSVVELCWKTRTTIAQRIDDENLNCGVETSGDSVVVDLSMMNQIVNFFESDRVVVLEAGVTVQQLSSFLDERRSTLTMRPTLATTRSSILANCLIDGVHGQSINCGSIGQSVAGLEVVLADGSIVKTGSMADSNTHFGRSSLPDVSGLFVGWRGLTGVVTKVALYLPRRRLCSERLIVPAYSVSATFAVMRALAEGGFCDDVCAVSWPVERMLLGVSRLQPIVDPKEPQFFIHVAISADIPEHLVLKRQMLDTAIGTIQSSECRFETPIVMSAITALSPSLGRIAERVDGLRLLGSRPFSTHSWIAAYGPLSYLDDCAEVGMDLMVRHGMAPSIISNCMKDGLYGALRFVCEFDRTREEEADTVCSVINGIVCGVSSRGLVVFDAPAWAMHEKVSNVDVGHRLLTSGVKSMLDRHGIFGSGAQRFTSA